MKLTGLPEVISTCKMYTSEFLSWWPKVRPISWPLHYKPTVWGTIKMFSVSHKPTEITQFFQGHDHSPHLWWSECNWQLGVTVRSPEVKWGQNLFFFANKSWEDWDRYVQTAPHDLARRAALGMCTLTYLLGSWSDLDLTWGQILKFTFQDQKVLVSNCSNWHDKVNMIVYFYFCIYISESY